MRMVRKGWSPSLPGVGCLSIKQHFLILTFLLFFFPSRSFSFSCQYFSSWILELLAITISTITFFSVLFAFLILHDFSSWPFSHLSNNFLSETAKVTQMCWTKVGLGLHTVGPQGWILQDDSVFTLYMSRRIYFTTVCIVLNSKDKNVFVCLFRCSLLRCWSSQKKKKKDFSSKLPNITSFRYFSSHCKRNLKRGKHKDNYVMTHIYLVILISEGALRNVITTHIHVVGCPSVYIANVRHDPGINQNNYYNI